MQINLIHFAIKYITSTSKEEDDFYRNSLTFQSIPPKYNIISMFLVDRNPQMIHPTS